MWSRGVGLCVFYMEERVVCVLHGGWGSVCFTWGKGLCEFYMGGGDGYLLHTVRRWGGDVVGGGVGYLLHTG